MESINLYRLQRNIISKFQNNYGMDSDLSSKAKYVQLPNILCSSNYLNAVGISWIIDRSIGRSGWMWSDSAELQREVLGDQVIVLQDDHDVDFKLWEKNKSLVPDQLELKPLIIEMIN